MLSVTELQNDFGNLSQNTSSDNLALGLKLMNIEQRYLLQKYFSNEGRFTTTTVGAQTLTTTASLSAGDTSATLTSAWPYVTSTVQVTFSNGNVLPVLFTRGSTAITWTTPLTSSATTSLSLGGLQFYPAPPNYSKLNTVTISNGNLTWTPKEILTREEWDRLNVFPYYSDIPVNYFIYPGGDHGVQIGIWPIPSTTGNTITYNYKFRIPDLSLQDDTTGTVSVTSLSSTVTGSGTSFVTTVNPQNESRWIKFSPPTGDNLWYQIDRVTSTTALTLYSTYQGTMIAGGNFTIGQMPIIMEDFHDMLLWKALAYYFSTIVDNPTKFKQFQGLYNEKLELLAEYSGAKTVHVNLGRRANYMNPNLFPQNLS